LLANCLQILKGRFCERENYLVMIATARIILDNRRMKKKTNKYPLKLQVTFQRVSRLYPFGMELTEPDYKKLSAPRISEELVNIRDKLKILHREADIFIENNKPFSFFVFETSFINTNELFKPKVVKDAAVYIKKDDFDYSIYEKRFKIFKEDHGQPGTISGVFFEYIKQLLRQQRIGTALKYQDAFNSIKSFKGNIRFTDITVNYLIDYEQWMLGKGRTKTTVAILLRCLRCIFNEAFELKIIKKENCYPFGKRRYQIPISRNIKKALHKEQIKAIYLDVPECDLERKAKDLWLFLYFANGMNPKDVLYLKYKNIEEDYFVFTRAKTDRTSRQEPKPIIVYITEDMKRIMENWGNKDKKPENYIFPYMNDNLNPLKRDDLVRLFTHFINDYMKKVTARLGITQKVTTIVSRHSFSTQLKRSGASTEFIQEALGHSDKKTTENYLDSFMKDIKKEYAGFLTTF